jgi:hypothetical protein
VPTQPAHWPPRFRSFDEYDEQHHRAPPAAP